MIAISLTLGLLTAKFFYTVKGQWTMLGLAMSVLAMVYFLFYGSGQLILARIVPSSAAIVYTNFAAFFAAMGAGWAWRLPETPMWRRAGLSLLLCGASLAATCWPLLSIAVRPPPNGGDDWENGVARQTSWATCSPAAAATLFHGEGIEISERELIPLCLTDSSGTPTLGLYRGVRLVAKEYGRSVTIVEPSLQRLISDDDWPVLIAVELPFGVEDRRYADQWGWIPGMGHSVVALGRTEDGGFLIGDPSVGLEIWREDDMKLLWHGNGIRVQ
nr:peptidase C39 [Rubripirellula reticaptiva]